MKHIPKALFLCLLITTGGLSQSVESSRKSNLPDSNLPPPKVEVDTPLNSPLRITAHAEWIPGATDGISLNIKVENVSTKVIRAYATRHRFSWDESERGCFLLNTVHPGKELQPGQSDSRTTWRSYPRHSSEPLRLSLDFIEFTDESVWGLDTCQSAERLAGTRAGARTVAERLQKIFAQGGPRSVERALDSIAAEIKPPVNKSRVWTEGFFVGEQQMLNRVRQCIGRNGITEVETVLKEPYDASGYKVQLIFPEPGNQEDK